MGYIYRRQFDKTTEGEAMDKLLYFLRHANISYSELKSGDVSTIFVRTENVNDKLLDYGMYTEEYLYG